MRYLGPHSNVYNIVLNLKRLYSCYLVATLAVFIPGAPACAWFLRITSVRECLYAYVCVSAPKAINNLWYDIDPIRLVE